MASASRRRLAHDTERIIAAILVQIADAERAISARRNPTCRRHRQDRPITQPGDRVLRRRAEDLARLRLREGERRAFVAMIAAARPR